MGRTKKVNKEQETRSSENVEQEELSLTELEMRTLDMYEARVQMNRAVRDTFAMREKILGIEYLQAKNELRMKGAGAEASMVEAEKGYNSTREKIQMRLGVNLNDYVVSDSGQLRYVKEE